MMLAYVCVCVCECVFYEINFIRKDCPKKCQKYLFASLTLQAILAKNVLLACHIVALFGFIIALLVILNIN